MKCYNHPGVGAVGRCAICARPLCRDCIVVVDGKRYCKEDAATLLARQQRADSTRRSVVALTTASVLAALDGLSGIVVGFLLIILGLLGPASSNPYILSNTVEPLLQYFANVIVFPASQALEIGFALMILGTADMIAGYYLWRRSKLGAIVSVAVTSVAGGLLGGYLIIFALAGGFTYVYIISAVVKLMAIVYGWRRLEPFRTQPSLRVPPSTQGPARGTVGFKKNAS